MNTVIKNSKITLEVSSVGAEMQSIKFDGREYLWQGDPEVWEDRAPVLFPFCGRTMNETYLHEGKEYKMGIHGFLWKSEMQVAEKTDDSVMFTVTDNEYTRSIYPFSFKASVFYKLDGNKIINGIKIENTGDDVMYFSHGYHPGFVLPFSDDEEFSDLTLEFSEKCQPKLVEMTNTTYLVSGNYPDFPLVDGKYLPLTHELFDRRSVFMKDMAREIKIHGKKTYRSIKVSFPECEILGLWQAANMQAKYLCVEPWNGLPDLHGKVAEVKTRPCERSLAPGECFENAITITLE